MLVTTRLEPAAKSATILAVVVHGLKRRILETVPPVIAAHLPEADVLMPLYEAGPLSNADPSLIAKEISDEIDAQWHRHKSETGQTYQQVILVGHSRGALLVRKAYVFARGQNQEISLGGLAPVEKDWHAAVTRIVLLAGMNRGWSLSPKPPKMPWIRYWWLRTLTGLTRLTGQAQLLREIRCGAPFVANLRVQWIRLCHAGAMPLTIQILGDMDDLVLPRDNIDLQSGKSFVYLNAPKGTTHSSVVELDDPGRRAVFVRALCEHDLKSEYIVPAEQEEDASVERVVFVMHGIRDYGGWTRRLSQALTKLAAARNVKVEPVVSSYGYFPMGRFLLLSERQRNVRWFMDRYTEVLARYRNAKHIDFVGHSNGTYLLGSALRRYQACTFGQVVCAGSVLPRDFEWDEMIKSKRITGIRNYLASGDWVVGFFPSLFDSRGDIGSGGFLGFIREPAVSNQVEYVTGGHSGALVADNFGSIAAFVLDNKCEEPPDGIRRLEPVWWVRLFSKLNWVVWLLLAAGVLALGWYITFMWSPALLPYAWLRGVLYVALLLAILNTI